MFSHEFSGVIALDGSADPSINLDNYDQDHLLQLIDTLNGHHAINLYPYLKGSFECSKMGRTSLTSVCSSPLGQPEHCHLDCVGEEGKSSL